MVTPKKDAPAEEIEGWSDDQAAFLPTYDFQTDGNPFVGTIESSRIVEGVTSAISNEQRDVPIFTIVRAEDGERFSLWGSGMLARVLPDLVGRVVRIEDRGLEPQGDGTSIRRFDVRTKA